jgi:hypothetical protein
MQRKDLLNLFQNDQFGLEHLQQGRFQTGSESSLWMNKRNILVGKIYLRRISDPSPIPLIIATYNLTKVNYLQTFAANENEVASLINQCPCLKSLDIIGFRGGNDSNNDLLLFNLIDVKILLQLVEFTSEFNHRMSKGALVRVAENCKVLQVFSVSCNNDSNSPTFCESEISKVTRNNADMRRLNLVQIPITFEMMKTLAQCCPQLTHLTLNYRNDTIQKLTEWVQIVTSFKHLQHLHNEIGDIFKYCHLAGVKLVDIAGFDEETEVTPGSIALFTEIKGFTSLTLEASMCSSQLVCDLMAQNNSDTLSSLKIMLESSEDQQDVTHIHVMSVVRLLTQCKCLTALCLQRYYSISQEDWVMTASSTSTLRSLIIEGSNTLTIDDIVCWMDNNKLLTCLYNNGIKSIL